MHHLLIADSDKETLQCLTESFKTAKYKVATASNSTEVLTKLAQSSVDILIMDVLIPGNEDFTLIPEIQKISKGTQIIAMAERDSLEVQTMLRSDKSKVFFGCDIKF